jgi:hypothetical protein
VKKNVDKRLLIIKDVLVRLELIGKICMLQLTQSPEIFAAASKLLIAEYINHQDPSVVDFIQYFKSEWVDQHDNWYEGYIVRQRWRSNNKQWERVAKCIDKVPRHTSRTA